MRYLLGNNLLFLHIPKTGGVAIENAIAKSGLPYRKIRHRWNGVPGRHARRCDLTNFPWEQNAWAFCFVRHPLDWYVSCWRHLHCMQKNRRRCGSDLAGMFHWYRWHPQKWLSEILTPDFDAWIDTIVTQQPGYLSRVCEEFIGLSETQPHVKYVGRQETLGEDIKRLLGISKVPKTNASHGPIPSVSSESVAGIIKTEEQILRRYYGPDTAHFRHIEDWANGR